jgi:hypothetical protein
MLSMALVLAGVSAQVEEEDLQESTASFLASSLLVAHTTLEEFSALGASAAQRSPAESAPARKLAVSRAASSAADRTTPRDDIVSPIARVRQNLPLLPTGSKRREAVLATPA